MVIFKVYYLIRTAVRFTWVVAGISCCLLTYFCVFASLKVLSFLMCLCCTRNFCTTYNNKIESKLYKWLLSFISCWFAACGYTVYEHGDDINSLAADRAFVISNHLESADVPVLMHKFINTPEAAENLMWVMDKSYRLTFLGWVAGCHGDFFIKQGKQFRESELNRLSAHMQNFFHRMARRWVIFFPEGGFLEQRRKVNDNFTSEKCLPKMQHITLPRFGALRAIHSAFKELHDENAMPKWLIDITLAYPPNQRFPTLSDIFLGRQLDEMDINVLYRVYRISDIPFSNEDELTKWMYGLYYQKEAILDYFYKHGNFPTINPAFSQSLYGMKRLDKSVLSYSWKYYAKLHAFFILSYVFLSVAFAFSIRFMFLFVRSVLRTPKAES